MLSLGSIAAKIFGTSNERRVRVFRSKVEAINALEPELVKLSDGELEKLLATIRDTVARTVESLPSHAAYVSRYCGAPDAAAA